MLSYLTEALIGMIDSAMVGRLGATELAAVGFGTIWIWVIFSLLLGTAQGIQTFVAQADGAGESRVCGAWVWQGFYAVIPVGLLMTIACAWITEPALAWLGPSPELQARAAEYIYPRLVGEFFYVVMFVFMSFFRGLEDMRTPLYVVIFVVLLNGVFDYLLIFGSFGFPEMGVAGAGTATAIATTSGAVVLFAVFQRRLTAERYHTRPIAPNTAQIWRFLRTSAPIGGQESMGIASFAVFNTLVARMGDNAMAASQAFFMLLSLSFMQAIGISIASSTLVGRYVGAGDPDSAANAHHSALKLGICLAVLVGVLFIAIPGPLMRIFTNDPEVIALGRPLLLLGAFYQFMYAAYFVAQGSLRGAGDTRWAFAAEVILGWGLFIPTAYYFGVVAKGGLMGAWYGGSIYVFVLSVLFLWRFRSRAWLKIQI